MTEAAILSAAHLTRRFGTGAAEVVAVNDVDLALHRGELALIMGPSGSGKTTLLSMLGALLRPSSGTVTIDGIEATALSESRLPELRAHKLGFVFQAFNLLDALSVEEVADRVLWLEDGALRDRKAEPHEWMRDPVCGMRVDAWTATIETHPDGARYVFCSTV